MLALRNPVSSAPHVVHANAHRIYIRLADGSETETSWASLEHGLHHPDPKMRARFRRLLREAHELRARGNPLSSRTKKLLVGGAVLAAAGAAAYLLLKPAAAATKGSTTPGTPTPAPPVPAGTPMQWVPVQPTGSPSHFDVAIGTYRATAQTSGNVTISKDQIIQGLEVQGLTNITLYAPTDPVPADWPDQRSGQNLWRAEATVPNPSTWPVVTSQSFLFWSGTVTILSAYEQQPASSTPKVTWTVPSNGAETAVDLAPNDVLEVRMPPPAQGDKWYILETGQTTAQIMSQSQDPATLEWVIQFRMQAGQGQIFGEMQSGTPAAGQVVPNTPPDYSWQIEANVAVPQA